MRKQSTIPPEVIQDYWQLFVNRVAYTLQSRRPHPETGRHYYFRARKRHTGVSLELNEGTIRRHLEGEITIGLYAINPESQCCKWVAIDADYTNAFQDLLTFQYRLSQDGLQPVLEMSRRGGHLWIFFEKPLLARDCRIYIHDLASKLAVPVKESGCREGIELFPKHDTIEPGRFGNAIRGPLGIHRGASRQFWFYGADYAVEAQVAYLKGLRKLTEPKLQALVAGKDTAEAYNSTREKVTRLTLPRRNPRSEFRILEYVEPLRKVGRNYIARCPSCAETGHDRSGDNLAILIEDPRFYLCWAGCSKQAIRSALGCPVFISHVREMLS